MTPPGLYRRQLRLGWRGLPGDSGHPENPVRQRQGNLSDQAAIGTVNYNRGVIGGIMMVEAIRVAQRQVRQKALNGDEVRWGLEHLDLSPARLKALGAANMIPA